MPRVQRSRELVVSATEAWALVGHPRRLAEWWPHAERVERVTAQHFTLVLRSAKAGKQLRADYVRHRDGAMSERWTLDVDGTPFARLLQSLEITVSVTSRGAERSMVTLTQTQRYRGSARVAGVMARRGSARQLQRALDAAVATAEGRR